MCEKMDNKTYKIINTTDNFEGTDSNENILFLGPPGSGKSTLIDILTNKTHDNAHNNTSLYLVSNRAKFLHESNGKIFIDTPGIFGNMGVSSNIYSSNIYTPDMLEAEISKVKELSKIIFVISTSSRLSLDTCETIRSFMIKYKIQEHTDRFLFVLTNSDNLPQYEIEKLTNELKIILNIPENVTIISFTIKCLTESRNMLYHHLNSTCISTKIINNPPSNISKFSLRKFLCIW